MRKALIVGIDYYAGIEPLSGCVNDAYAVKAVLERHADGTLNFPSPQLLVGANTGQLIKKSDLKESVRELFKDDAEIALFYFAGHGYVEDTGGFLCTSECERGDDGLALAEVLTFANESKARNKVIILDSCYSGAAADRPTQDKFAEVTEGLTVLSASTADQEAFEVPGGGSGVFTSLFVNALNGAAANLVGDITPGSVYAHIDQSLGPWAQRPVFKTYVKTFVSLRRADPPVTLSDLRALTTHFPVPDYPFRLDPSYEPERSKDQLDDPSIPKPDPTHNAVFAVLQKYARVDLVRPVDAPHMWHAAMQSKSCQLTVLGQHYWDLVKRDLI
jgi:Caspase domain